MDRSEGFSIENRQFPIENPWGVVGFGFFRKGFLDKTRGFGLRVK